MGGSSRTLTGYRMGIELVTPDPKVAPLHYPVRSDYPPLVTVTCAQRKLLKPAQGKVRQQAHLWLYASGFLAAVTCEISQAHLCFHGLFKLRFVIMNSTLLHVWVELMQYSPRPCFCSSVWAVENKVGGESCGNRKWCYSYVQTWRWKNLTLLCGVARCWCDCCWIKSEDEITYFSDTCMLEKDPSQQM